MRKHSFRGSQALRFRTFSGSFPQPASGRAFLTFFVDFGVPWASILCPWALLSGTCFSIDFLMIFGLPQGVHATAMERVPAYAFSDIFTKSEVFVRELLRSGISGYPVPLRERLSRDNLPLSKELRQGT